MKAGTHGITLDFKTGYSMSGVSSVIVEARLTGSASVITLPAVVIDTAAGTIRAITREGDFIYPGTYKMQVVAEFGPDLRLKSDVASLEVTAL